MITSTQLNFDDDSSSAVSSYVFHPRTSRPEAGNKYYIREVTGGWNGAVAGNPTDSQCNVLSNCVGYANGRFNEIGQYGQCRYQLTGMAGGFIEDAQSLGLQIGQVPRLGAIICWAKPSSSTPEWGHVAVVEEIVSDDKFLISESCFGGSAWTSEYITKVDGSWWYGIGYVFRGFIYNPAVPIDVSIGTSQTYDGGPVYEDSTGTPRWQPQEYTYNLTDGPWNKELITFQETRDVIYNVDNRDINAPDFGPNLLSYPSLVESPYINVTIGEYTFGKYQEKSKGNITDNNYQIIKKYPNFITSLNAVKINGQVNVYTINLLYQIRSGDDPNFIDKVLSTVGYGKIKISYGDYASPSFIYKEEEAIITKVTQKVNFQSSSINYTISCTSSALQLLGSSYSYLPHPHTKPSKVIKDIIEDPKYRLTEVFPGMIKSNYGRFLIDDDAAVDIPAKQYMDPLSYINFLVSYMIPESDNPASTQRSATYFLTIHDDSYADYSNVGGSYFKISKISSNYRTIPTFNTYTVDVGYPGGDNPGENLVMDFQVSDDNSWSLLYNYYNSPTSPIAAEENYTYSINDQGQLIQNYSPNVTTNARYGKTTAAMKAWWTRMTEFPIQATLVIKGLVRSAMLMTYLRVNSYFYGKKHVSSGLYVITKQEDKVDSQGYRTTLSLTRIAGADDYIQRRTYTRELEVFTGNDTYNNTYKSSIQAFDEQVVSTAVEDKDINKTSPWSGIIEFDTASRWIVPEGCAVYAVFDQEGNMYTDTTKWPFVSIDRDENVDNKGFILQRLSYFDTDDQYDLTYFNKERGEYYFPQDMEACQADWVPGLGFAGRWLAVTVGNQVYFHLDTYDGIYDQTGTSGQFLPQLS